MLQPYQRIFRDVRLSEDEQGKSDWATNHSGEFYAIGVGGGVTVAGHMARYWTTS